MDFSNTNMATAYVTANSSYDQGNVIFNVANAAFNMAANNFTLEAWVNLSVVNSTQRRIFSYQATGSSTVLWFGIGPTNKFNGEIRSSTGTNDTTLVSSTTPIAGVWYHVAFVRNSGNTYLYVNGTQEATATGQTQTLGSGGAPVVGAYTGTLSNLWNGYITNLRVVNGTAMYTTNFTPSTSPLTSTSNTSLLMLETSSASFLTDSKIGRAHV